MSGLALIGQPIKCHSILACILQFPDRLHRARNSFAISCCAAFHQNPGDVQKDTFNGAAFEHYVRRFDLGLELDGLRTLDWSGVCGLCRRRWPGAEGRGEGQLNTLLSHAPEI